MTNSDILLVPDWHLFAIFSVILSWVLRSILLDFWYGGITYPWEIAVDIVYHDL